MDREWSSQPLASDQTGWDWFSLHLQTGEKLMLFRLRQADGQNYFSGNWIGMDGKSTQIAVRGYRYDADGIDRDRETQSADLMEHRRCFARIEDRKHATEREQLDGNELSLLGRTDQLPRQP